MDPNSQHQEWSEWTFRVHDAGCIVPRHTVQENAARWLRKGFGSVGAFKLTRVSGGWLIVLRVEGAPLADPDYVRRVRQQFNERFVKAGFGPLAWAEVRARVLAGERIQGRPRNQWIMTPELPR